MKAYSLDEYWELLASEYIGGPMPWIDRMWYQLAIRWLQWRLERCR